MILRNKRVRCCVHNSEAGLISYAYLVAYPYPKLPVTADSSIQSPAYYSVNVLLAADVIKELEIPGIQKV